ncbi:S1 RNA-binding domain-containing protein, partial [Clostridium sp. HCS.1]|uniref:S1 RNA-binding domain-containing protein n=1 Tax=Clostridium sp. HCS.1 TaxID=3238594 RepID=UPI003A1006AE
KGIKNISKDLEIGELTLEHIIKELKNPGRDIRDEIPKPLLNTGEIDLQDLSEGMVLMGSVRNVSDYGAFVDIGVHQDGLVHKSQMADRFVKHPFDIVKVG